MCALLFVLFDKPDALAKSMLQNSRENEIAMMEKKRDQYGSIFERIFTRFSIKFRIENLHYKLQVSLVLVGL